MGGDGRLEKWAGRSGRLRPGCAVGGFLRFAFYGQVSTEDWQDPESSLARRRAQAGALVRGRGRIVTEFFDAGESRMVAWGRRPAPGPSHPIPERVTIHGPVCHSRMTVYPTAAMARRSGDAWSGWASPSA